MGFVNPLVGPALVVAGTVSLAPGTTVNIGGTPTVAIGSAPVIDIANANVLLSSTDVVCLINRATQGYSVIAGGSQSQVIIGSILGTSFVDELLVVIRAPNLDLASAGLAIIGLYSSDSAGQYVNLGMQGAVSPILAAPTTYDGASYFQAAYVVPLSSAVFAGGVVTMTIYNHGAGNIFETLTISVYGHLTTASVQPSNDLYSRGSISGALGLTSQSLSLASGANGTFPALGGGSANMQIWNASIGGQTTGTGPLGSVLLQSGVLILDTLALASPGSNRVGGLVVPNGSVKAYNWTSAILNAYLLASPHA